MTCPVCKGDKKVIEYGVVGRVAYMRTADCKNCHGTGTIDTRDTICEITKDGVKMYRAENGGES
jgi:DnaJ-class molecular chaperone